MWKIKQDRKSVPKYKTGNRAPVGKKTSSDLYQVQKNIYRQASLALLTVVLTIVILFAMTSAWYTNIVQTNGLFFEAESWGFEGEINVSRDNILASPGDDGLVHLEVQNGSDQIAAISVNISKDSMEEKMQKRMFFYVDEPMVRNDETMSRVYINELESYTYTLFHSGKLTLTDKIHNAPQLKWQWVYDVLGYYVLAERYDVVTNDGKEKQLLAVKEYLRPIEYNYDEATFGLKTDETGKQTYVLTTVDGNTTPQEYLKQLSKTDGYKGEIKEALNNGCYPVSVDENGYGIYAYLCDYAEIQDATDFDTELGQLAYRMRKGDSLTQEEIDRLTYNATLIISAQKNDTVIDNVHTLSDLKSSISEGTADVIQLNGNVTLSADEEPLQISDGSKILLDLNGYSVISKLEGNAVEVLPGGSLTVINGEMIGPGKDQKSSNGIYATGAEVTMSKVKMSGFTNSIYLSDALNKNLQDSCMYITDCDIQAESCAVLAAGNGTLSDQRTQLIVENSKLHGGTFGLSGNGDSSGSGRWGTEIQLINSEIVGDPLQPSAGIYHPQQNSSLMIYDCTVYGYTGMAIKGGFVTVEDSNIAGQGISHNEPKIEKSGFTDTGDGVYIETGYSYETVLEIRGSSNLVSTASNSRSLRVFEQDSPYVAVSIYSGKFNEEQPDAYIAPGSVKSGTSVQVGTGKTE